MQPDGGARRRFADAFGRLLVAGGGALLLVWGAASGHAVLGARLDRAALARVGPGAELPAPLESPAGAIGAAPAPAISDAPAATPALLLPAEPDTREWSLARVAAWAAAPLAGAPPLGLLEIPRAGIAVAVHDGTDELALNRGVGRIAGTAGIAEPGNLGIAGHRDGFFRGLRHLREGDVIRLVTAHGERRYRVEWTRIVLPEDVSVLGPTEHDAVTLVTCHPFWFVGSAPERFIVRARAETAQALAPAAP